MLPGLSIIRESLPHDSQGGLLGVRTAPTDPSAMGWRSSSLFIARGALLKLLSTYTSPSLTPPSQASATVLALAVQLSLLLPRTCTAEIAFRPALLIAVTIQFGGQSSLFTSLSVSLPSYSKPAPKRRRPWSTLIQRSRPILLLLARSLSL
jgi:hypothetical protein